MTCDWNFSCDFNFLKSFQWSFTLLYFLVFVYLTYSRKSLSKKKNSNKCKIFLRVNICQSVVLEWRLNNYTLLGNIMIVFIWNKKVYKVVGRSWVIFTEASMLRQWPFGSQFRLPGSGPTRRLFKLSASRRKNVETFRILQSSRLSDDGKKSLRVGTFLPSILHK